MRTDSATSFSMLLLPNLAVRRNQVALERAQTELSTGRHYDVGLQLGGLTSRNIKWHAEVRNSESQLTLNDLNKTKSDIAQASLKSVSELASRFMTTLVSARSTSEGAALVREEARYALQTLREALNVSIDGAHLFSGQNIGEPPFASYEGGSAELAVETAFSSTFGFANQDPAVSGISKSQLQNFLDGPFNALFDSPSWESDFSNAAGPNVSVRIRGDERIDLLASANEKPFRDMHQAILAVLEVGTGDLNASAFEGLIDFAIAKTATVTQDIPATQARIGIAQRALADANVELKSRRDFMSIMISRTESADPYEVTTRINGLMTQLEASYSVTARLSRISLLNHL